MGKVYYKLGLFISILAGLIHQPTIAQQGQEIKGHLEITVDDDFKAKQSKTRFFVRELKSKHLTEIKSKKFNLHKMKPGSILKIKGHKNEEGSIEATEIIEEPSSSSEVSGSTHTAAVANMRSVLAVRVHLQDKSNPCGTDYFTNGLFGETNSANSLLAETSKGRVGIQGQYIEVTIPFNHSDISCTSDYASWGSAVMDEAMKQGYNYTNYDHFVMHYPSINGCGAGRGSLSGPYIWMYGTCAIDAVTHEFGHNLGLHHAGSGSNEYADRSDFMGYGGVGLRQVSGPRMIHAGWIESSQYQKGGIADYTLSPLELSAQEATGKLQVLTYSSVADPSLVYYLSYRQDIGYDRNLASINKQGLAIHSSRDNGLHTNYITTLADGESYNEPGGTFSVQQISHDLNGVKISTNAICSRQNPTVTMTPGSQSAVIGSTRSISVTVQNNDSAVCGESLFSVAMNANNGLSLGAFPQQLQLSAGNSQSLSVNVQVSSSIGNGRHEVSVNTKNLADLSKTATATASILVDSLAPSTPTNLTASSTRSGISLSWSESTDLDPNITYFIHRNNVVVGQTTSMSFVDSNVTSGTTYSYTVVAKDSSGNAAMSSAISFTYQAPTKGKGGKGGGDSSEKPGGGGKGRNK